jgi:hypothetical protein
MSNGLARLIAGGVMGAASLLCSAVAIIALLPVAAGAAEWSSPVAIDTSPLVSVSCTPAPFCAAVDTSGSVATFAGTSWSAPLDVDAPAALTSVSCPSASFCAAVDSSGNALTFNGTTWSPPKNVDGPAALTAVSCASEVDCVAVDLSGDAVSFDGASWSAPKLIDSSGKPSSISCPSAEFCAAVDKSGNTIVAGGGKWGAPVPTDPGHSFSSVSCASPAFCLAVDVNGYYATYEGGSWSPATPMVVAYLSSVSCPAASFCVAVNDGNGYVRTYDGLAWGSEVRTIETGGALRSVSCPTAGFCAAVDGAGNALTWGAPRSSPPSEGASASARAALAAMIAPGGSMQNIRALLRHNGYTMSFDAPGAGRLVISWHTRSHRAGTRPALLAYAAKTIRGAGVTSLRVALTRRGRRLLRHSRRVSVSSAATFVQSGGPTTTVTRPLTLRR